MGGRRKKTCVFGFEVWSAVLGSWMGGDTMGYHEIELWNETMKRKMQRCNSVLIIG